MINGFPGVQRAQRRAAIACLAGCMAVLLASAAPADAQSRHRLRAAEKAKKEKTPPPPPGPHLFIVSLKSQRAVLYANGTPVAQTPISSGTASHPTPTGVFSVIQKNRHHRSNIYSGAPMPFMQRLTWSGIALHQGQLPGYPASHGCIRLPGDFASYLWRTTKIGARVIVTHGDIAPSEISHAKLFQTKPRASVADTAPVLRRSIETEVAANTLTSTATDAAASDKPAPEAETAKAAEAATDISAAAHIEIPAPILASFFDTIDAKAKKPAPAGPVSVFISRKDKQLYVRQGMQALFNVPVSFRDDKAFGTHVFTALNKADGSNELRWIAVTMPGDSPRLEHRMMADDERDYRIVYRYDDFGRRIAVKKKAAAPVKPVEVAPSSPRAADVLDRIELPQQVIDRVSEYITAGATLIVSDQGLGYETGAYTDFIVLTR
jgi:hypothetical protein